MNILRSGVVLFVFVSILALAIGWALLAVTSHGDIGPADQYLMPILQLLAVSLATCIVLMLLSWRGRRQPMGDGVISINVLVLGYCFVQAIVIANAGPPKYPDSAPSFYLWWTAGFYLACLVPAYLICYLALCRTALLRGLVPSPNERTA